MKTITMIPTTTWQSPLSVDACATSALRGLTAQGIAVRPYAPNAGFAPFAADDAVAHETSAVKRDRAITGKGRMGVDAVKATNDAGSPAWSPPI